MASDEAVKAAIEYCNHYGLDGVERLADLLDRMMAQARLEEHEPSCGLCLTRKNNHGIRCRYGAELERLVSPDRQAGRGK